jgi:hypothetical protein
MPITIGYQVGLGAIAFAPDGVPNTFFGGVYSDFLRTLLLGTIAFLCSPIAHVVGTGTTGGRSFSQVA